MSRVWMITGAGRALGRAFTEEAVREYLEARIAEIDSYEEASSRTDYE